jgi:4-amino-4-deoxy-L-arabinose transferase-like glycosyltransferase
LLAGAWVGLAFQAKMLQAWLIVPALFLAYLIAAPAAALLRRVGHVALCSLVVAVISLSWMTAVSAVPAHDRPYVDGSCDNSVYSQVFVYNGLDRFHASEVHQRGCSRPSHFLVEAGQIGAASGLGTASVPAGWSRLLHGVFGRDDGWLLVPAVVAAAGLFVLTRRRPRIDALRAATILWSGWLVLTWAFFSSGRYLNSYYLAALIPALAALCGLGAAAAWQRRHRGRIRLVVLVTVVASTVYAITLVPSDAGVRPWIITWLIVVTALATGILVGSLRRGHGSVWATSCGLGLAFVALVSSAVWASGSVLVTGEGPFDGSSDLSGVWLLRRIPEIERGLCQSDGL